MPRFVLRTYKQWWTHLTMTVNSREAIDNKLWEEEKNWKIESYNFWEDYEVPVEDMDSYETTD